MSEAKHTPLPWSYCCNKCYTIMSTNHPIAKVVRGDWGDDYPSVRLVGNSSLALKAEPYMAQITYGHIEKETAAANGALIVRAVNAHDALVEALKACLPFIDDALDAHSVMSQSALTDECRAAVALARNAIAKAESS